MLEELLVIAILGGLVGLDTTAAWQTMFSHPLLSCVVAGYLFGEPELGLFFGIVFELIWLYDIPVGGAKSPDGNLGSFLGVMLAIFLLHTGSYQESWLILVCLIYATVISYALGRTVVLMRKNNLFLVRKADRCAEKGDAKGVARAHLLGVIHSFVHAAFWGTLCFVIGVWLVPIVLSYLPEQANFGVREMQSLFLGIGLTVMFQMFITKKRFRYFWLSVLSGAGLGILW